MYVNPFQISLDTLIGAAPLLGHALEDRAAIRQAQDWHLGRRLRKASSVPLRSASQRKLFAVAPLDLLVTEEDGRKTFHPIEVNGTGIGGLTNLPGNAVSAVLESFYQTARDMPGESPVILVASSGKEKTDAPRLNKLIHEKILYAEALKRGFDYSGRPATVHALNHLAGQPASFNTGRPAIVLGYMKEFLEHLRLDGNGRLSLFGRPVNAAVNDRFCLNVVHHFKHQIDLGQWWTMNRGFLAGADKGVAYSLLNDFLQEQPQACFPGRVHFCRVFDRDELIATVLDWLRQGRKAVIKPQGTGLGHGIRFFLSANENAAAITTRIDESLRETEEYYGLAGGAFPYTVCEYLDTCAIRKERHPLRGHKFEIRVVVYRDGDSLQAFPSIAKIASEPYDGTAPAHLSLINNITTSSQVKKTEGVEFMMPLSRRETLDLLGIGVGELESVCAGATRFVRYLLDQVEDQPQAFGLPADRPVAVEATAPGTIGAFMGRNVASL